MNGDRDSLAHTETTREQAFETIYGERVGRLMQRVGRVTKEAFSALPESRRLEFVHTKCDLEIRASSVKTLKELVQFEKLVDALETASKRIKVTTAPLAAK